MTLDVTRRPAWRDIFQKALYGQSTDRLWNAVRDRPDDYVREYGLSVQDLRARLASIEQAFARDATTRRQDVPKAMVRALSDELTRAVPEIARIAGRLETEAARGEMAAFSVGLTEQIDAWRQAGAR